MTPTVVELLARPLVLGLGVTGAAVVEALRRHGVEPTVLDDAPAAATARAAALGVELEAVPADPDGWRALVAAHSVLLPSPGVPDAHPAVRAARAGAAPLRSELDLAAAWDRRPVLAVTGTNGKTTVVGLVAGMLRASGLVVVEAGNTEVPLVAAIADEGVDAFVVEASSFRLGHTHHLVAGVRTWLNLAPDHLDVHESLAGYEAAKARLWADLEPDDVAVANAEDPVVLGHLPDGCRRVTFAGAGGATGAVAPDWRVERGHLVGPPGAVLAVDELPRRLPHDLANVAAAAATAAAGGAPPEALRAGAMAAVALPHRVAEVGAGAGVRWFDDSKATTPDATLAAVAGFDSVVLVAGGRNKGLDLSVLAEAAGRVRAVVAIGEAAEEVAAAFAGRRPVVLAGSMADAVTAAADVARPGDVVLLSPACASFDWYRSYGERGDHFAAEVRQLLTEHAVAGPAPSTADPEPGREP